MMQRFRRSLLASCLPALWVHVAGAQDFMPVIQVSSKGRYLQTATGSPFFWLGDSAWKLYRLNPDEVDQYFDDRQEKGFTVIQGPNLLGNSPNYAGESNTDPDTPNPAWFTHIDTIVAKAEQHGLYIALVLCWGDNADEFTLQSAYDHGFYVGDRYKQATNIAAFFLAGEFNHPSANTIIWNQMALGLEAGLAGNERLIAAHPRWYDSSGGQSSSDDLHDFPWLAFNTIQSARYGDCSNDPSHSTYLGTHNWLLVENDHGLFPIKPTFDAEATYETMSTELPGCSFNPEVWDAFGVRRRAYWSVFAGGFGHTYGANGVYQFHKSYDPFPENDPEDYWDVAIDYPGATHMTHLRRLIESRPFFSRIPAQDILESDPDSDVPTHIHATRDADGTFAMIYIPGPDRVVTLDMNLISGSSQIAWWFDPQTAQASLIGVFTATDYGPDAQWTQTTPESGDDWVLVIDDSAAGYPPPGSAPDGAPSDIDGDGLVNVGDLLLLIYGWGVCPPVLDCPTDICPAPEGDGIVDVDDLLCLITNWS